MRKERWNAAQTYERQYWSHIAETIASDAEKRLTWYDWKASLFQKRMSALPAQARADHGKVLEVGSGPIGIVTYLDWKERYAVDPLNDFYRENPLLVELRRPGVNYLTGVGEKLPFPDEHFDVVIIDNVLDHVAAPDAVLREIHRVLVKSGLLYLEVNIHSAWGYLLHRVLSNVRIDRGHPHSYTENRIRSFLAANRYDVVKEFINSYDEARSLNLQSGETRSKVKGYTGLSEFIYCAICSKRVS